jgi:hypothetical protein
MSFRAVGGFLAFHARDGCGKSGTFRESLNTSDYAHRAEDGYRYPSYPPAAPQHPSA